jgi:hypothetical protein
MRSPIVVIPAKRSASRNPACFCGNDRTDRGDSLDSRFRWNDVNFWV